MGFRGNIVQGAKNIWSEVVSNKQLDKGILDYDRWQEYNKSISQAKTEEQQAQISQQMVEQGVIDPLLYSKYLTKQKEKQDKELSDPESDTNFEAKLKAGRDAFKSKLDTAVQPAYLGADRYQKEVISKVTEELTNQYEMTYNNVMETLSSYPSKGVAGALEKGGLESKRNEVSGEYENLIANSAKRFSELIGQGKTYQDAYKQIISEGKKNADRIVQLQNQLQNVGFMQGISKSKEQAALGAGELLQGKVGKGLRDMIAGGYKTVTNSIAMAGSLLGQGLEEGKQALGYYDTLEELSNLGVYKENEKLKGVKQLKNRAFEAFDGAPSRAPQVAEFFAGGKIFDALKVPEAITTALKAARLAPKTAEVTRGARFLAENIQDLLLNDAIAQSSMGRPMTDEDFTTNWLLNIPINGLLSRLVPTEWLTKTLPIKSMNTNKVSNGVLAYLTNNSEASVDDIAKAIYLDKAYSMGIDAKAGKKILEGVDNDKELFDFAMEQNDIKNLIDTNQLTQAQQDKYKEALSTLTSRQDNIRKGKMTLDDMALMDLGERIKATKGNNVAIQESAEAASKAMEQYKYIKDSIQALPNLHSKVVTTSLNNQLAQGVITQDQYKNIIESLIPEGTVARTVLESKLDGPIGDRAKKEYQQLIRDKGFQSPEAHDQINNAYETIQLHLLNNIDNYAFKPGDNIGTFTYLGKDEGGQHIFYNLFEGDKEYNIEGVLQKMRGMESNIAKVATYENLLSGVNQVGAAKIGVDENGKGIYDISNTFKGISSDIEYINKEHIQGEMGKAMRPFGMSYNKETGKFIITESGLRKLSGAIQQFEQSGWNVMKLSKDQMDAYKVVFMKPYLDAVHSFKVKGKDFNSYFEQLYKQQPDGTYIVNLKFKSGKKAGDTIGGVLKETKDFTKVEQAAAEEISEDILKQFVDGMEPITDIKGLVSQYNIPSLETKILSLANFVKDSRDKATLIQGLKSIMGDVLGDWKSNAYIKEAFGDIDSIDIYRKIVSSILMTDEEFTYKYLDNVADILTNKDMSKMPLFEEIEKARDIINPVGGRAPLSITDKAEVLRILNKQQELFDANKFEISDSFYKKHEAIKKEIDGMNMQSLSNNQITTFANTSSIAILNRYGVRNESLLKKLQPRIENILKSFQDKYPEIKLQTRGTFQGIGVDVVANKFFIDDAISMHALINLLKQDEYDKYIFTHEAGHLLTYKGIQENVGLLADRILENIKAIEGATESKGLDSIVFYNKDTLDSSMQLLDILDGDLNKTVNRLMEISNDIDIPSLYKIMGQVEEAVNEQQSLYSVYKYISDKDLLQKVKDKLESINSKLKDEDILQAWKSIAGNKNRGDFMSIVTSMPKSSKATLSPIINEIQEIYDFTPQTSTHFKDAINNVLNNVVSETDKKRDDTLRELYPHLSNSTIANANDVLDIMDGTLSYIAGPYGRQIKLMFGNSFNVDVKSMFLGNETLKKRQASGANIPFDIFATNKMIANVLSSIGKYTPEVIDAINNKSYVEIVNQILKSMDKDKEYTANQFLKRIEDYGVDTSKGLTKEEQEGVTGYIIKIVNDSLHGIDSGNKYAEGIYKIINDKFKINEMKIGGEWIEEGFKDSFDSSFMKQAVDNMVDDMTDMFKLQYDINLIGKDIPLPTIPFNSFIATIGLKNVEGGYDTILKTKYNTSWLSNIFKGNVYKDLPTKISYNGIIQSFNDGLMSNVSFKIGNKTIEVTKENYESINPYKLMNEFIEGLINEDKKVYELFIDGKSVGPQGSYRFFNQVPGKLILEKLELSTNVKYLYSPFAEPSQSLLDKEILQKIYDTFSMRKISNSMLGTMYEWQQLLKKNKGLPYEEMEKLTKDFLDMKKKVSNIDIISADDVKYMMSKASKQLGGMDKFSIEEGHLYNALRKYLYPKQGGLPGKELENIQSAKLQIYTKDGFKDADAEIIAIRPKMDILEGLSTAEREGSTIVSQTYSNEWISIYDAKSFQEATVADEVLSPGLWAEKNMRDGEFMAKVKNSKGEELNGLAIMDDKGGIKFIPMKNPELLDISYPDVAEYRNILKNDIKIITDSEDLMKSFLVC